MLWITIEHKASGGAGHEKTPKKIDNHQFQTNKIIKSLQQRQKNWGVWC